MTFEGRDLFIVSGFANEAEFYEQNEKGRGMQ